MKMTAHMKKFFYVLILLTIIACTNEKSKNAPLAHKGFLDLQSWNFEKDGRVSLYGEWEFYYRQFLSQEDFHSNIEIKGKDYIEIPALWNTKEVDGKKLSNLSFATYRLKLFVNQTTQPFALRIGDMYSAYTLWVNGEIAASNGVPGKTQIEEKAEWYPIVSYINLKEGENEIILHISNFSHRKGGTWSDLELGIAKEISNYKNWLIAFDFFLVGSLMIMAIYHFGLFTLRRVDITSLLLGLFCICSTLRIGVTGERLFVPFLPFRSFETQVKVEYISFFLSIAIFFQFAVTLFQETPKKILFYFVWLLIGSSVTITLLTRATIYSYTAIPLQVFIILLSIYIFHIVIKAIVRKVEGARAALTGMLILFTTIILEMLYQNEVSIFSSIPPIYIYPFGVFLFLFFQSFLLSQRFSRAFYSVEHLSNDLLKTNEAISKFVPTEFLNQLNKESVMDVHLGDQVQRVMAVLFSDIREFTNLSETMSPSDNFNFINSYIKRMNPHIQENNGFIDKYIGDAIMALFPKSSEDALKAAIQMCIEVNAYNTDRLNKKYKPIQVGFGIHSGSLMLGIIGANNRMDGTVISDSVNLASRLEGLTKEYKVAIIVSESVIKQIEDQSKYHFRLLDKVQVKGKQNKVIVYHIYDGLPEKEIFAIDSIKAEFEDGVKFFHAEKYAEAYSCFSKVKTILPSDYCNEIYIKRCEGKEIQIP
jgi:adenylate cyclase